MIADDYEDIGRRLNALEGKAEVEPTATAIEIVNRALEHAQTATQAQADFRSQYAKACRELDQP